jgi:hypothetical protein
MLLIAHTFTWFGVADASSHSSAETFVFVLLVENGGDVKLKQAMMLRAATVTRRVRHGFAEAHLVLSETGCITRLGVVRGGGVCITAKVHNECTEKKNENLPATNLCCASY